SVLWIAEVDALAAAFPRDAALDRDVELCEPPLPSRHIVGPDREREMTRTGSVVPRHEAAVGRERTRIAALKQQQHGPLSCVQREGPAARNPRADAEQGFVNPRGWGQVVAVERGLENPSNLHRLFTVMRMPCFVRSVTTGCGSTG